MNLVIEKIVTQWNELNFLLCILIMFTYFITDEFYARYTIVVSEKRAIQSATSCLSPGRESNPRMAVLQTAAFPLRHQDTCQHYSIIYYFVENLWVGRIGK